MNDGSWLDHPLKRNVDAKTQADLAKLDLVTVRDLLWHFPRRYLHLGELTALTDLSIGDHVTLVGKLVATSLFKAPTGAQIYRVKVNDGAANHDITFFNPRKLVRVRVEGK